MRRVHTSFDWFDAHIIVARLREEEIDAHVFDSNFVNLNWFKMLAFRGFRIVVPDSSASMAVEIIEQYRTGILKLHDADHEHCPSCTSPNVSDDPVPRRITFVGILASELVLSLLLFEVRNLSNAGFVALLVAVIFLVLMAPMISVNFFKWRYRCAACRHRWKGLPQHSYSELMALANAADARQSD